MIFLSINGNQSSVISCQSGKSDSLMVCWSSGQMVKMKK